MDMNISCKFEKSTYNTLSSRGVTRKSLHTAAVYPCVIHSIHRMLSGGYNNMRVISTLNFGYLPLTMKEGPKVKPDHIRRFLGHDFL